MSTLFTITPNSFTFQVKAGGTPPLPQSANLAFTGPLAQFIATTDQTWLNVTPPTGSPPLTLTLSVDATGLTPGAYSGNLTVTSK